MFWTEFAVLSAVLSCVLPRPEKHRQLVLENFALRHQGLVEEKTDRFFATFVCVFLCSEWRRQALPVSAMPPELRVRWTLRGSPGLQAP